MKKLPKMYKVILQVLGIGLLVPCFWLLFKHGPSDQQLGAALGIAAPLAVAVAVVWYLHRGTQGGNRVIKPTSMIGGGAGSRNRPASCSKCCAGR